MDDAGSIDDGEPVHLSRFDAPPPLTRNQRLHQRPSRSLELAWQRDSRVTRAAIMSLLYLVSGLQCLLAARWGTGTQHHLLVALMGAFGVVIAPILYGCRRLINPVTLHLAAATYALLLGVLASIATNQSGVLGLGPAVIAICIMNAYFSTRRALWWHLTFTAGCFAVGVFIAQQQGTYIPALSAIIVAVGAGITLNRLSEKLRRQGSIDELTGTLNRAAWMQITDLALLSHHRGPVVVAILDLDDFKETNDNQGHLAGDRILQIAAGSWTAHLPRSAVLGRFGGDEFLVLFRGLDLENVRRHLAQLQPIPEVTWTFGTALAERGDLSRDLLHRADSALLAAKKIRSHHNEAPDLLPGALS